MNAGYKFITSELPLGAYLIAAYHASLTQAIRQGNRVVFHFESSKDLEKGVQDYYSGKDKVSAVQFVRSMDLLRDAIRRVNSQS